MQVLARQGIFPHFDYLSTVSGGGYLGAFLTAFLGTRPEVDGEARATSPSANEQKFVAADLHQALSDAFHDQDGRESPALRHLRNNSRYLLSGGLWARFKMVGLIVTGILTNILLLLPLPLWGVLCVVGLNQQGYWGQGWPQNYVGAMNWPAYSVLWWTAWALAVCWKTGLDFLTALPDEQQAALESTAAARMW